MAKMDIPEGLTLSPVTCLLIDTLDPVNKKEGWQTLYDMVMRDQSIVEQVMFIDPKAELLEDLKVCDELYVPPLPKAAQLDEQLLKIAEGVGRFHRDCTSWLKQKSPMTPNIQPSDRGGLYTLLKTWNYHANPVYALDNGRCSCREW